jgi:hypothetical protein
MFIITTNDNHLIAGPSDWHQKLFQSFVDDHFEYDNVKVKVPPVPPASGQFIDEQVRVWFVQDIGHKGEYNPKIQQLSGPFYDFDFDVMMAKQYYIPFNKSVQEVKDSLKAIVADNRWKKETGGLPVPMHGKILGIDTNRGSRDIFLQAFQMGSSGAEWKFKEIKTDDQGNTTFGECWMTLSNAELGQIVLMVMGHVQTCFTWEGMKTAEIDSKTTLEQLDEVVLDYVI